MRGLGISSSSRQMLHRIVCCCAGSWVMKVFEGVVFFEMCKYILLQIPTPTPGICSYKAHGITTLSTRPSGKNVK
jgi:hypothetical protein